MIGTEILQRAIQAIGIHGVSTAALMLLLAVALYAHKAASTGQKVVYVGSTVTHDLKVVALVLVVLLVIGVINADLERGRELIRTLQTVQWGQYVEQIQRWIP